MAHVKLPRYESFQCDKTDRSGVAIVFDVALDYPRNLPCQTLACQISLFTSIHEKFNTQSSVNITADDGSTLSVDLCHVQSYPNGNNNNQNSPSGVVIQPCSIVCQNGGQCTGPTTCACTTGWSGDTCTIGNLYAQMAVKTVVRVQLLDRQCQQQQQQPQRKKEQQRQRKNTLQRPLKNIQQRPRKNIQQQQQQQQKSQVSNMLEGL
ncbi:unnamed protein product [Adineta steineri]|uniref:EGF-like domain-containing protein n=1 Tax=Adineta steineri TaxID=433720 RepID=A0A815YET6_9BILA|nr:unnamed protein product [Adineta steineri]